MSPELSVVSCLLGGDMGLTGEENMPDTGSMPYSSRIPVSFSVIPVLLKPQYQHLPPPSAVRAQSFYSPSHLSHLEVLIARPPFPARRMLRRCLPSIFASFILLGRRDSHTARRAVFLVQLQCVGEMEQYPIQSSGPE